MNSVLKHQVFSDVEIEELCRALGLVSCKASSPGVVDVTPVEPVTFQSQTVEEEEGSNSLADVMNNSSDKTEISTEDRSMFVKLQQYFNTVSQHECNEQTMLPPLRSINKKSINKYCQQSESVVPIPTYCQLKGHY